MKGFRWFLIAVASAGTAALLVAALVLFNANGFSARQRPTAIEGWIAHRLRSAALPSGARTRSNPVPNIPEVLAEGAGALGRSLRDLPRK